MAAAFSLLAFLRNSAAAPCRNSDEQRKAAQSILDEAVRKAELAGVIAVLADDACRQIIIRSGYRNAEKRLLMTEDSIFDIRSITKPVTALAALSLVDKKRLDLDWPITDVLPEARSSGWAHRVTLRHLLTHTGGLGQERPKGFEGLTESRDKALASVAAAILHTPLAGELGEWRYSSLGYCLAGRVIEVAADRPFAEFVTHTVLRPLQMFDSSFLLPASARNRMASLYQRKNGAIVPWPRQLPRQQWAYDAPDF